MSKKIAIRDIKIGARHRKDLGDLQPLADSIGKVGLLQPIGVTSSMQLVWGERRLRACESLGWSEIDAVVDPSLDDAVRAMKSECDENTCRKDFSPSEAVAIAEELDVTERQRAEERMRAELQKRVESKSAKNGQFSKGADSAPLGIKAASGKTRVKVAAAVGLSHDTLTNARKVVAGGAPELVEAMDRGDISVNAASKVAALPIEEQKAVVAGGKPAIAAATSAARPAPSAPERPAPEPKSPARSASTKPDAFDRYPDLKAALLQVEEIAALPYHHLSVQLLRDAVGQLRDAIAAVI